MPRKVPTAALTAKQEYWRKHLEACRRSGTTTAAYAAHHGLDCRQLYTWRNRLTQLGALPRTGSRPPTARRSPRPAATPTLERSRASLFVCAK